MTQTSTTRRNIIIASIVIVIVVISSIVALIEYTPLTPTRIYISLSTNQTDVIQGSNSQIQVTVTSIGKAENITLGSNVGLGSFNCTFEPSMGISNFSSKLTVNVPDSSPTGNYSIVVTASSNEQEENASLTVMVIPFLSADVITVSGRANSAPLSVFPTILTGIQFTDIQTDTKTSFSFPLPSPLSITPFGSYSVTLMNDHTYNVTVSYFTGPTLGNMYQASDYIGNFTVHAPVGQKAISQDFGF